MTREELIRNLKYTMKKHKNDTVNTFDTNISVMCKDIEQLPSVTQKSGKWIVHPKGIYAHLVCNKCLSSAPYDCKTNYCPNCGAKMAEVEE